MPEYAGDACNTLLDDRTDHDNANNLADVSSTEMLRIFAAKWTQGRLFDSGFPASELGNVVTIGSSNIANDIAVVDITGGMPTVVQLQRVSGILPRQAFPRPASGIIQYRFGIVIYDNATDGRYANLYYDNLVSSGHNEPSGAQGWLYLYRVDVPNAGTCTTTRIGGVSQPTRVSLT